MRRFTVLMLSCAFFVSACANTAEKNTPDKVTAADTESSATIAVYKFAGTVQCGTSQTTPAAIASQLSNAGIQVLSSACGNDGKMRITLCGAPDGQIYIFNIPATQTEAARSLGFAPLSSLAGAVKVPCRN